MKFSNMLTEINNEKGLFYSAALSLILHLSFFVANPVFSVIIFDKLEDSNGRFISVAMINAEEKALDIAANSEVQNRSEKAGNDGNEKVASIPEGSSVSDVSHEESGSELSSSDDVQAKPVIPALDQAPALEDQIDDAKDTLNSTEPLTKQPSSFNPSYLQEEVATESNKLESKKIKVVHDRLTRIDAVESTENPVGLEGEPGPEAVVIVKEDAAAQLYVAKPNEENVTRPKADEIKDGKKIVDAKPEMEEEVPVDVSETLTPEPEQDAPIKIVAEDEMVEIKEEGQKESVVSKESPEDKQAEVVRNGDPGAHLTGMVHPDSTAVEFSQDVKVEEKKEAPVNTIRQMAETDAKRSDEFETAKDKPDVQDMSVPDKKIEEIKVVEKKEETVNALEQKVAPSTIKKKRIDPFHKVVEPGKEAAIGVPLGRPFIRITSPAKGKTGSSVQTVSGRVQGKGVTRVVLSINGRNTTVPAQDGYFLWETVLRDGKNIISGTVRDIDGNSASDTVMVEVLPSKNGFELAIDEPGGEIESPVAKVKGRVEDTTVETVKLIVNGEIIETAVDNGVFEKTVLFKERENILEAEAVKSAGAIARAGPLSVTVKNPLVADILVHIVWNDPDVELNPSLLWKKRSQLDDKKEARKVADMDELMSVAEGYKEKIFSVREADGAYALKATGGKETDCKLVVSLISSKKVRIFEKRLMEGEEWFVGRFLVPEGVFWDEDEWFSGKIEGSDCMTKYKSPEGITWKELK